MVSKFFHLRPNLHNRKFLYLHHPVTGSEDEERLVRDLFRGYNKLIRPVQNMTQKVDVRFGLAFVQLINVVSVRGKKGKKNFQETI
jgi:Neurotransmitter-gated ion-channel ligand binding domain